MDISPELIVSIDYEGYFEPVRSAKPVVYKDGEAYCCQSGPNPLEGIFGAGATPGEAIEDWLKAWAKKNKGT